MKVTIDEQQHVAHVDFDRAAVANSLDETGWAALRDTFRTLGTNPEVNAILLTGAGKHFCAGMNVSVLTGLSQRVDPQSGPLAPQFARFITEIQDCITAIANCRQPVVAAIQGGCIGGGVAIATACDIRYCTPDAKFVVKEVDFGIVADIGTLQRLPRLIPFGLAAELAMTGRPLLADEALRCGLVNQVYSTYDKLIERALAVTVHIASKESKVTAGIKRELQLAQEVSIEEGLAGVAKRSSELMAGNLKR